MLLLKPASREIAVYGDGSFSSNLLAGAWATHIPAFRLQRASFSAGPSCEYFEFCALVEGMRAALAIDHTSRPLRLHTDSEYVMLVLRYLSSRSNLPARRSFDRIRDLYARTIHLIGTRPIRWRRARTASPFHRVCHQLAITTLRQHVWMASDSGIEAQIRTRSCGAAGNFA